MTKSKKTNNPIQPYIEQLTEDNEQYIESEMQKVYLENDRQMNKLIKKVTGLYATYTIAPDIPLNTSDSRRIKAELADSLTNIGLKVGKTEEEVVSKALKNAAEESHNRMNFILQAGFSQDLKFSPISAKEIDKIINKRIKRQTYSDRIWNNQADLILTLEKELKESIKNGKSVDKVSNVIKERFGVKSYQAKLLSHNEIKNVQSYINAKVFAESPVVKKVMWSSTLDERTREEHADLDGETWDANGNHPNPADFVGCRCVLVPLVDGWSPTNRRDHLNDKVINYTTYNEWKEATIPKWLKEQKKSTIEKYLGGYNKRILFEAGVLKPKDYKTTLKELEKNGIMIIRQEHMKHVSVGDFTHGSNRPKGGGHGQINIEYMKKHNIDFRIDKTLNNGVRLGHIPNHKQKFRQKENGHTWFPKDWTDEKIQVYATKIINIPKEQLLKYEEVIFEDRLAKIERYSKYENVIVKIILNNEGKFETAFPYYEQEWK